MIYLNGTRHQHIVTSPIMDSIYYNPPNSTVSDKEYTPQRQDLLDKTLHDILKAASNLPVQGRVNVLQYMTQLDNISVTYAYPKVLRLCNRTLEKYFLT